MNSALSQLLSSTDFINKSSEIAKNRQHKLVVITNDISNFKYLNDFYGMEEGDKLLEEMARYFYIENPNCLAACRTGCDQFRGIFDISDKSQEEEIEHIVYMNSVFEKKMSELYPNIYFHVYTGLYFLKEDDTDIRAAIDYAHVAKKQIKGKFNIKCQVYTPDKFKHLLNQMEATNMFIQACENDGILVYLQPKVSVSQNKVIGAEALVRLRTPEGRIVSPGEFIPVLEATGMIGKLDLIMIEKIFIMQKNFIDKGFTPIPISINISRQLFSSEELITRVIFLQNKYQIPARLIEFEVLETTFNDATEDIAATINSLREYGFSISVDDFGSGYSSLNQIANIPADIIKIDRGFITNSLQTSKGRSVIKSLISLLQDVEYDIVFEGIETQEQLDIIHGYGCDIVQGYFYDKPLPSEEFENKYMR